MERTDAIRVFVSERVQELAQKRKMELQNPGDAFNLLESGLFDSLGFVELIAAVEGEFDIEIDFGEGDPEAFTTIAGLVKTAAEAES